MRVMKAVAQGMILIIVTSTTSAEVGLRLCAMRNTCLSPGYSRAAMLVCQLAEAVPIRLCAACRREWSSLWRGGTCSLEAERCA